MNERANVEQEHGQSMTVQMDKWSIWLGSEQDPGKQRVLRIGEVAET